jgi:hypothetical protein
LKEIPLKIVIDLLQVENVSYFFLDLRALITLGTIIIELEICLTEINIVYYSNTNMPIKGLILLAFIFEAHKKQFEIQLTKIESIPKFRIIP